MPALQEVYEARALCRGLSASRVHGWRVLSFTKRRRQVVDAAAGRVRRQRRPAVPHGSDQFEQESQDRLPDRNGDGLPRRANLRAPNQPRSCLQRYAADGHGIDVAMHFQHQRFRFVPLDDQGGVDRSQRMPVEAYVDDRSSDRLDCSRWSARLRRCHRCMAIWLTEGRVEAARHASERRRANCIF